MMDIELPRDYVFHAHREDLDHESPPIPVYSPLSEATKGDHCPSEEIVMTNYDQSDDSEIGEGELMSDPEADDDDDEDMKNSEEDDPEEDPEED